MVEFLLTCYNKSLQTFGLNLTWFHPLFSSWNRILKELSPLTSFYPKTSKNIYENYSHVLMDSGCKCLNYSLTSLCKYWKKSLIQTSSCSTSKRSRKYSKALRCFSYVRLSYSPSNLGGYL